VAIVSDQLIWIFWDAIVHGLFQLVDGGGEEFMTKIGLLIRIILTQ
jgi:hypothetical protein